MESCYRSCRFRVHRGRGNGSSHSASDPSAVKIAWQCELPPTLWILNTVHGVEPPPAYARVSELSGMFPLPPGEGTLKVLG